MSFTTSGRTSRNAYTFVATADDNNARFRCEAKNEMNRDGVPMTSEVVIAVQFAPEAVVVSGPATAKVGDNLAFDCETSKSNPPASIQWVVDGRTVPHNFSQTVSGCRQSFSSFLFQLVSHRDTKEIDHKWDEWQ